MGFFDDAAKSIKTTVEDANQKHIEDLRSQLSDSGRQLVDEWATEQVTPEQLKYNAEHIARTPDEAIKTTVEKYSPKIRVNNDKTGFVISGSRDALDSGLSKELKTYLNDTFKYSDLSSANVAAAIDEINKSISDQINESTYQAFGGNYEYAKDYANAVETMQRQNPMSLSGDEARDKYGIWGYDKNGNRVKKLPQEWVDYWRENYSSQERAALFEWSKQVANGTADAGQEVLFDYNLRTPYLVMSGGEGGDNPVYGFDIGEQMVAFGEGFVNALNELGKGFGNAITGAVYGPLNISGTLRKNHLNDMAHDLGHAKDVSDKEVPYLTEKQWNDRLNSLVGKNINDLSSDEQAFLATSFADRLLGGGIRDIVADENGVVDNNILNQGLKYEDYNNARDNLSTTLKYTGEAKEQYERQKKSWENLSDEISAAQIYAPVSVGIGNAAGVILRTLAESGAISTLTGGLVNLANIGDGLAESIIKLASLGSNTSSIAKTLSAPLGKFLLTLAGEIPEDIIQTAVDNVITGHGEENDTLLTPSSIAQNTLENLVFRAVFGTATKALDYVSTRNMINRLKSQTKLLESVDTDKLFDDWQQFKTARENDSVRFNEQGNAVITDANGNERVLENVHANIFSNTGDAQLDAIGKAWRDEHYAAPIREKLAEMQNDEKSLLRDIVETKDRVDAARESGAIKYTGVQNVITVPKNDPYYGLRSPEIKVDNTGRGALDLATNREPQKLFYYIDLENILKPDDARKAEAFGSLTLAADMTNGYMSPSTIASMAGDDINYGEKFLQAASNAEENIRNSYSDIDWSKSNTKSGLDEIKQEINRRIEDRISALENRIRELEDVKNSIGHRQGFAHPEVEDAEQFVTNVLGRIQRNKEEIVEDIIDIMSNDKSSAKKSFDAIKEKANGQELETEKAKAISRAIKNNGAKLTNDITMLGKSVDYAHAIDDGVAIVRVGVRPLAPMGETIYHIPEGTKILRVSDFMGPEGMGIDSTEYAIDTSAGYEVRNGQVYVNNPDGSVHTPVLDEFNTYDYTIKYDYDQATVGANLGMGAVTSDYERFGKEYLKPVGKSRTKASDNFYELIKGGGSNRFSPNVTSARLRSSGEMGQLNPTTPTTILDKIIHDAYAWMENGDLRAGTSLSTLDDFDPDKPLSYDAFLKSLGFWKNAFYTAGIVGRKGYRGNGSGLDSQLDAIINTYMSPEMTKWRYTPNGQQFIDDLDSIKNWVEEQAKLEPKYRDGLVGSISEVSHNPMPDSVKEGIAERLLDLSIKYQGQNGFEMLPLAYKMIDGYKYAAPYEATKPFVVTRGMGRGGNFIGDNTTGADLFDLKVGDDWVDKGYAFTTLSPEAASSYTRNGADGAVYFRYHIPAGAPVIYYGDTSHFGEYVAIADGGPIVLPRNWPAKVAKVTHTRGGTVVDIAFADKKGNYAGLITPKERLAEKLKGTNYEGRKLEKALDNIFGDGSGEIILSTVAGNGDIEDVTYNKIYKFLDSEKSKDLNQYLFHQLETEPLILFRGQQYGAFEGDINVDEVGFSNEGVIRNLQSNNNAVDTEEIDSYPFTQNPDRAREFGENIVRAEVDRKYILSPSEMTLINEAVERKYNDALEKAYGKDAAWKVFDLASARRDIDNFPAITQFLNDEDLDIISNSDSLRAYAAYSQKPIVEYIGADGDKNYLYFPGTNEDFDKSMTVNMYDSKATTFAPAASESNDAVAANAFKAVETQPYNKSTTEIVNDLYDRMSRTDLPASTPDSSSDAWSEPRIDKNYYKQGKDTKYVVRHAIADMPVNPAKLNNWHANSVDSVMESFRNNFMPEFTKAYPTPEDQAAFVRNMDYLFHLQKREHVAMVNAIGREYSVDGATYKVTLEDAQFYKNFVEPQMRDLRNASKAALGVDIPTTVGYFPHTDYSPENLTSEEILQGVLWKHYTGSSAMEDGNFTTAKLSDNMETRYRTFVNNMLWDVAGERLAAAKFMEEMHADGVKVTAKQANNAIKAKKAQAKAIESSSGAKKAKAELKKSKGEIDWKGINEDIASTPGSESYAIKAGYGDIYGSARGNYSQPGGKTSIWTADHVSTMSVSDWMRAMITPDGSLYDQGGALVVNGDAAAKYMAGRFFNENMDAEQFRGMLAEFLMDGGRRSKKGAEYIANKWMDKLASRANNAPITRMSLASELQWMIRYEGISRVDRWIARADLSQFSKRNVGALDQFIRRQGIISSNANDSDLMGKINTMANKATKARMASLFWFNFKNGVLQTSECIRLFTEFKIIHGDALPTIKRLATDKKFRETVDEWVDMLVPDRYSDAAGEGGKAKMLEGTAEAWAIIANRSSITSGGLTVEKLTAKDLKDLGEAFDKFASSPVDFGEKAKNRVLVAGILQEAERKGLSGNELFNYVNKRFERIGLAANDMGRLTAADNPFFRLATNLKSFGIREANMYINNIRDLNDSDGIAAAMGYVIKNLGWKSGLLLIMSKLGYGALSVFGLDPFGLMDDQYTGVDEEDYNWMDRVVSNPAMNALLSGGFTSFIPMLYWASRQSYESTVTPAEDAERTLDPSRPAIELGGIGWDQIIKMGTGFVPGYTQGQRVVTMTDLLNRGWATGATGNKKYEAPTSPFGIATGYVFGQSTTPQARAYNQTPDYIQGFLENGIAGVGQQIGREWGGYRQFDPVDRENYSDWFNGTKADEAQWRAGYYHFSDKINEILNTYEDKFKDARNDSDRATLKQSYNQQLNDLMDDLKAFTDAYTLKNPSGIDEEKMNNLINILNTYRTNVDDSDEVDTERSLEGWNQALQRYAAAGLPAITTYRGNNAQQREETGSDTSVQYSPQIRAAVQGEFGLPSEAASQIRQLYDDKWKDLNKQYRNRLFSTKGSKAKAAIQKEYINIVRQDLDPVVEMYGNNIWSNEDVENIIDDVFNSMVPKYGQSAKSYLKEVYKDYHGKVKYSEQSSSTISQIKKLLDDGKTSQAKALARALKQRVQENRSFLTRNELEWLQGVLND